MTKTYTCVTSWNLCNNSILSYNITFSLGADVILECVNSTVTCRQDHFISLLWGMILSLSRKVSGHELGQEKNSRKQEIVVPFGIGCFFFQM